MNARNRSAGRAPGAAYMTAFDALHKRTDNNSGPAIRRQPIEELLPLLSGVRSTGEGRWIARCPAHEDRHPSLSIRELDDGRLLVHCFSACDTAAVLRAVGLEFADLYPGRPEAHGRPERRPWHAQDVLACLATEATVAAVAASRLADGEALSDADRQRLMQAAGRLSEGAAIARGVLK